MNEKTEMTWVVKLDDDLRRPVKRLAFDLDVTVSAYLSQVVREHGLGEGVVVSTAVVGSALKRKVKAKTAGKAVIEELPQGDVWHVVKAGGLVTAASALPARQEPEPIAVEESAEEFEPDEEDLPIEGMPQARPNGALKPVVAVPPLIPTSGKCPHGFSSIEKCAKMSGGCQ